MNDLLDHHLMGASHDNNPKTILKINELKFDWNEALKKVKQGRIVIWVIVGLSVLGMLIGLVGNPHGATTAEVMLEGVILIAAFAAFAFLVPRNPFLWMCLAMGLYVLYQLLLLAVSPVMMVSGFIFKIVIIVGLVRGIAGASTIRRVGTELNRLGVPKEEISISQMSLEPIPRTLYDVDKGFEE